MVFMALSITPWSPAHTLSRSRGVARTSDAGKAPTVLRASVAQLPL